MDYIAHDFNGIFTRSFFMATIVGVKCWPIYTLQLCMGSEEDNVLSKQGVKHVIVNFNSIYYTCVKKNTFNYSRFHGLQL